MTLKPLLGTHSRGVLGAILPVLRPLLAGTVVRVVAEVGVVVIRGRVTLGERQTAIFKHRWTNDFVIRHSKRTATTETSNTVRASFR